MQHNSPYLVMFPQEQVKFTSNIVKINRRNSAQQRHIVITGQRVYNIKESSVKRAIDANFIEAFVMSKTSYQFVIRVQGGYDYRFCSPLRWTIYEQIINLSSQLGYPQPALYLVEEATLEMYSRSSGSSIHHPLKEPILFEFDNSLNTLISNLLQSDHRVLYIADPHLYEIRPIEITELLKLGRSTSLVKRDHHNEKLIKKVIYKSDLLKSTTSIRKTFNEYKQNPHQETVSFVLENPDTFIVFSRCYRHSLADDIESFKDYSEQQIKKIFHQILNIILVGNIQKVSLKNFIYDDIEEIIHTEFEDLRPENSETAKQELSPEEYHLGTKAETTILWKIGVLLYKLVYGVGPILTSSSRFFKNAQILYDEDLRAKLSENLNSLISELLDFDWQKRMDTYKGHQKEFLPTVILRHPWMN